LHKTPDSLGSREIEPVEKKVMQYGSSPVYLEKRIQGFKKSWVHYTSGNYKNPYRIFGTSFISF